MLNRRQFAQLAALAGLHQAGRGQASSAPAPDRCSVMLWALASVAPTFEARVELVAQAGYRAVELVREFTKWDESELARVLDRMHALRLEVDAIAPLAHGFADPAGGAAMLAELNSVLPTLRRFGRPQLILVSGPSADGIPPERQRATAIATLRQVAEIMRREQMVAVIEPIDRIENPRVFLDGVTEAFAMVREVGQPEIRVLYDFFHEQRTHGDLIEKLQANVAEIGLVHIADVPGRHQPGTGEVNYANIYRALQRLNYKGRVAMEFYPEGDSLGVLRSARLEAERLLAH